MAMTTVRTVLACISMLVLSGCPVDVALRINNVTNETIVITSTSHNLSLAPFQSLTIARDDFQFDRDAAGAEMLQIRRRAGSTCHEIIFADIGLKDGELEDHGTSIANLVIAADGNIYVIPNNQSEFAIAKNYKRLKSAPKLKVCEIDPAR